MANRNTNPGISESVDPGVCGYIVLRVLPIARWDVWDARDAEMRKVESSTNSHKSSQIGFMQMCADLWSLSLRKGNGQADASFHMPLKRVLF